MKIKKYTVYLFILIIVLVSCIEIGLNVNSKGNIFTINEWRQKKKQLQNIELSKITFYTGGSNAKTVELTGAEKDSFMNCLFNSEFYRNNRTGQIDGGMAIILISKDGSNESFEYCGGGVFQLSYKQDLFSIKNKELEQILFKYNITL